MFARPGSLLNLEKVNRLSALIFCKPCQIKIPNDARECKGIITIHMIIKNDKEISCVKNNSSIYHEQQHTQSHAMYCLSF